MGCRNRGLWASERLLRGLGGGDLGWGGGVEQEAEAGTRESGANLGTEVTEAGLWRGGAAWGPNGRGRSLRAAHAGCTAGPLCAHVPT